MRAKHGPGSSQNGGKAAGAALSRPGQSHSGEGKGKQAAGEGGRRDSEDAPRLGVHTGFFRGGNLGVPTWRSAPGQRGRSARRLIGWGVSLGFGNRFWRSRYLLRNNLRTASRAPEPPSLVPAAREPASHHGGHSVRTHPGSGGRRSGSAGPRDRSGEGPGAGRRRRSVGAAAGRHPAGEQGARSARGGSWPRETRAPVLRRASGRHPRQLRQGSRSRRPPRPHRGEGS